MPLRKMPQRDSTPRVRVLAAIGSLGGGGSERQLIGVLRRLDRARFAPSLYLTYRAGEFLQQVPEDVPVIAFSDDFRPPRFHWPGRIHRQQVRHLAATLAGAKGGGFDVLYDRTPHMTLVTAPAARRSGIPRVSTIVADPSHDIAENLGRFPRVKRELLRRAYQTADRVVANGHALRAASVAYYGLPESQVLTIPNGFDFEWLDQQAAAAPLVKLEPEMFHIVALGRLQSQKAVSRLIEAVAELVRRPHARPIRCWLIGQGPDAPLCRARIDELGIATHVRLTGFLENPYPLLRQADLFVLPSRYEGMPNALVEAMALGVPVLATDCPHGPREILLDGQLGTLVDAHVRPSQLAEAIQQEMDTRGDARHRAAVARATVRSQYSLAASVAQLESTLADVATRRLTR